MPAWKAELTDSESVLAYYDEFSTGNFRVYAGAKPEEKWLRVEFLEDNKEKGKEKLDQALQALVLNPMNTNVYCLELVKKVRGNVTTAKKKILDSSCITFQLNFEQRPYQPGMGGFYQLPPNQPVNPAIKELSDRLDKIAGYFETNEDEEEELVPEAPKGTVLENAIAGIIENPEKLDKLAMGIQKIFGMINLGNKQTAPAHSVNESDVLLDTAIQRLKVADQHLGSDLHLLAEVAEKDPKQFNMLIGLLRDMIK